MSDIEFNLWRLYAWGRHLFGAHTWVPSERWTLVEGHAMVEITGFACWRCPATRSL